MSDTIDALRDRLAVREAELTKVYARLKAAKDTAARPPVKASISAIQKRYLSAVADLETKRSAEAAAAVAGKQIGGDGGGGVSKLASRFNKGFNIGITGTKKLDIIIDDGHVIETRQAFANNTNLQQQLQKNQKKKKKKADDNMDNIQQPTELLVEDDDGLPSWAKNQAKLMIRKENARSSIRDVDVGEIKDEMLEKAAVDIHAVTSNASYHDGMHNNHLNVMNNDTNNEVVNNVMLPPRGSVKKALAMWGKSIEEDMKVLAMQKEEEERKKQEQLRLARQRLEEERRRMRLAATQKYARVTSLQQLNDLGEPDLMALVQSSSSSSLDKAEHNAAVTKTTTRTMTTITTRTSTTTTSRTIKDDTNKEDMTMEDVVMTKEEEVKIELGAFLERKIDLIDKEIIIIEEQAERVEDSINSL